MSGTVWEVRAAALKHEGRSLIAHCGTVVVCLRHCSMTSKHGHICDLSHNLPNERLFLSHSLSTVALSSTVFSLVLALSGLSRSFDLSLPSEQCLRSLPYTVSRRGESELTPALARSF